MRKGYLVSVCVVLFAAAALSISALGTLQPVSIDAGCDNGGGAGISTATAVGGLGSAWTSLSPTRGYCDGAANSLTVSATTSPAASVTVTTAGFYSGAEYDATYGPGGTLTITTGPDAAMYLTASFESVSSSNIPTYIGENNPNSIEIFSGTFYVYNVNPVYFGGLMCMGGNCGTGSIYLYDSTAGGADLGLSANLMLWVPGTSFGNPEPTPEPGTAFLWISGGLFCALLVENRQRSRRTAFSS